MIPLLASASLLLSAAALYVAREAYRHTASRPPRWFTDTPE